jgi:ribosome silencing factor RsfS/YbeB/iojap
MDSRLFCSDKNYSDESTGKEIPKSLSTKYQLFEDSQHKPIYDYHEEMYGVRWDEKHDLKDEGDADEEGSQFYLYRERKSNKKRSLNQLNLKRGITGVFDIQDLVDALRSEQLKDLCVIRVPESANYCDYLVLVTAKNQRHLNKITEFIRKLYKLKKHESDPDLSYTVGQPIAKETRKSNWQILDFGNIVLHMFLPGVREVYDLESLWSVGPDYDEKTVRPVYDTVTDVLEKHASFLQSLVPEEQESISSSEKS